MSQVQQVVKWCTDDGMYVIINEHWDNGWFEDNGFNKYDSNLNTKLQNMWAQVAASFNGYDSRVLFACANEPNAGTAAQTTVLFQYYQNFVDTVRSKGGNDSTRWLLVQGPQTNIDKTCNYVTSMPLDPSKHIMIEVHLYDPFQFTQLTSDASWGKMFYFSGKGYHSATLPSRNATWGEEAYVDSEMAKMKKQFKDAGYPVLIGEYRATPKPAEADLTGANITLNYDSCTYWNKYVYDAANSNGLYSTVWDIPGQLFNWTTGAVVDQTMLDACLGKSCVPPPASAPTFTATASVSLKTIAHRATGAIAASLKDTGGAASNLITDIEVYTSAGTKVAEKTFAGQNFASGGAETYNWSWAAPAAAGLYTVSLSVFNSTWSARYYHDSNAATIIVGSGRLAQYGFESGVQSWTSSGGMIYALESSTAHAFAGSRSLAVGINSTASGSQQVYVTAPPIPAGKTVIFHVWIPSGSAISAVQPFVQQGTAGKWAWTGNYQAIGSLKTNAWNTLTVTVPSNAVTPLGSLGVQFGTSGAWTGTCYVDSVGW